MTEKSGVPAKWIAMVEAAEEFRSRRTGRAVAGVAPIEEHVRAREEREGEIAEQRVARRRARGI